jgi:hypothetical protein
MAKKKVEDLMAEVSLLDKVTGYKSQRGKRKGNPASALYQWREAFKAILSDAQDQGMTSIPVRAVVGTLCKESFFDGVDQKKRYRRSYNYFEQSRDHIPTGWELKNVNGYAHLVVEEPELPEEI